MRIPCFSKVREVLETQRARVARDEVYVLPELWALYQSNPDALTYRLKKLFVRLDEGKRGGRT